MDREEALNSIEENVENESLIRHMLATEAIMQALARHLGEDEEEWGLTGLLHDIDVELTGNDMRSHSKLGADLVQELGASEAMAHAILCHNPVHSVPCETKLDKTLSCVDSLAALIMAVALARPAEKLAGLTARAVVKSFKEASFAEEVDRQRILMCRELGVELDEFVELGLKAMQGTATDLGFSTD
jgi:putative nucleotidyltransferase with HDIG domain